MVSYKPQQVLVLILPTGVPIKKAEATKPEWWIKINKYSTNRAEIYTYLKVLQRILDSIIRVQKIKMEWEIKLWAYCFEKTAILFFLC